MKCVQVSDRMEGKPGAHGSEGRKSKKQMSSHSHFRVAAAPLSHIWSASPPKAGNAVSHEQEAALLGLATQQVSLCFAGMDLKD